MIAAYTQGDEPVPGFRLEKLLACETFGSVWKAIGPGGMEACIKIVSLVNKQRLKEFSALRLVKHVRHPNLVPILAFWLKDKQGQFIDESLVEDGDTLLTNPVDLIMVMGLGDKSLFDRLKEHQKEGHPGIPPDELLSYMEDVAEALDHLNLPVHSLGAGLAGIQHCDIKPQNILIVGSAAQVCDLGGARTVTDVRATSAVGSAAYMAPEYITEGVPSRHTDQYSLAVCYVELRTGSLPLNAKSAAAAYLTHIRGALDLSLLTAEERVVIARATSVRPEKRFTTCCSMVSALREACGTTARITAREKESSNTNINLLAPRNGMSTPPPSSWGRPPEPLPPIGSEGSPAPPQLPSEEAQPVSHVRTEDKPPEEQPDEDSSDDNVEFTGSAVSREHDTFVEGPSLVSRAAAVSFPPREYLRRTTVVQVHVIPHPSTADDEDDTWPTELDAPPKPPTLASAPVNTTSPPSAIQDDAPVPGPVPLDDDSSPEPTSPAPHSDRTSGRRQAAHSRQRRWLPVPLVVVSSALLGVTSAWIARNPASSADTRPTGPVADLALHRASGATPEESAAPTTMPPAEAGPLPVERPYPARQVQTAHAVAEPPFANPRTTQGFDSLTAAVAAAESGDTIVVQSNGPFLLGPLEIQGKELTIKAAAGARPQLELTERGAKAWRPLFHSDRTLTLEGLDLRRSSTDPLPTPAHLVRTSRAALHLLNCRLEVLPGSAAVVCQDPKLVEIRDCSLRADAVGLCVEVSDGSPCEIRLIGNTVRIAAPAGAAVSLSAPEVRLPSVIHLVLERNTVSAGRIVAFKDLPDLVEVDAAGNEFSFREAVVSFVGFPGTDGWRRSTLWHERQNLYLGSTDWVRVNGHSAGVPNLEGWRASLGRLKAIETDF